MANRTWLAVALCCLVWFVYMRWFAPPPPPMVPANPPTKVESGSHASSPTPTISQGSGVPVAGSQPSPFLVPLLLTDSGLLDSSAGQKVRLSAVAGKISSIELTQYTETLKKDSPHIESLDSTQMSHSLGEFFSEPSLGELGYGKFESKRSADGVIFTKTVSGASTTKHLRKGEGDYFLEKTISVQLPQGRKDWGYLIVPVGGNGLVANVEEPLNAWEALAYQNDSVTRKALSDINSGSEVLQGNTKWIGFGNRYFSTVVVNESSINPDVVFEKNAGFTGVYMRFPLIAKPDQKELTFRFKVFSGPKEYSELGKVPGMKQLIDYGMFSFLAYPLLELLRFFNRFLHNYGLAIILLTIVVRVLFYPLSLKSYRSMKGMQKLQPQIAALKEKYKDDAQRFGQEQMALFRANKVNPAGGCLPILVQLPVFIALYAVLQNSIELFHAPFYWWVTDLSAKDPFYVFPILMGISMFIQQKMTPAAGMDPMQQKILLLMPVIFTFIMLNLPSGLTIYIFVSTLLGILQQVLMNREREKSGDKLVPAPQPDQGR